MAEELADDGDLKRHKVTKQCFSEPTCQLSFVNGVINRMTKEDVRVQLRLVDQDDRGVKDVIKKRLKNYYKKQKMVQKDKQRELHGHKDLHHLDYYCVIDFEGTCEERNPDNYVHEIIEFPAVLLNGTTLEVVDEFHRHCRPMEKTVLSKFCTDLTGITQETVDAAKPFPTVLGEFNTWLEKHKLGSQHTFAIITDGPWDLGKFLPAQCALSGIPVPGYASKWINLRKHCLRYYKLDYFGSPVTLKRLLEDLGLSYDGRPHSGIDDARNISKMFVKMMRDGLEPRINDDAMWHKNKFSIK